MSPRRTLVAATAGCLAVVSCTIGPTRRDDRRTRTPVELSVVDEDGRPIAGATLAGATLDDRVTDTDGRVEVELDQPVLVTITANGYLTEPVALSPRDGSATVALWRATGRDGVPRAAVQFGGDVMLGRRYVATESGDPLVTDEPSAREIVSDLAPLMSVADLSIVNLETVVGELPAGGAYPGKRFLLQSPPVVTVALDQMGVDLVTLGNNHAYDWRDDGVRSTLDVLDRAGLPHVGGGLSREEAVAGILVDAGELTIGVVSFTTVNGDFVNDQLPADDEPIPVPLPTDRAWQYRTSVVGFGRPGDAAYLPATSRRPATAWAEFVRIEDELGERAEVAELWAALTAPGAYPELQDWVARRGHGGAAPYRRDDVALEIDDLRRRGADQIVVQVHGGFQFGEVKSAFVRSVAHHAIDDGADMVIAHHPHVLQGVEYYDGKLIAYSLGNMVFDQDFLSTFPTIVLRVVLEGDRLLEARALPVMLDSYRPLPLVGDDAARVVRILDARSALRAQTDREGELTVGVLIDDDDPNPNSASVLLDRNSGLIVAGRADAETSITVGSGAAATLPPCTLLRADDLPDGIEYGIDLVDWGHFDDGTADGDDDSTMHWVMPPSTDRWTIARGPSGDPYDDAVELVSDANDDVTMRMVARVTTRPNRLLDAGGQGVDGSPSYSLLFDAKRSRGEDPTIRLDVFHVDDLDPTESPSSTRLRSVDIALGLADDDDWHTVSIDLPADLFAPKDGLSADAALLYVDVPPAFRATVSLDNLRLLEWRSGDGLPDDIWFEADAVRAAVAGPVALVVSGC